ncbi:uncharacterized protein LAESUDRAFT_676421 [Laetiporus sulphureus 93-53]|uniref:Uncharacterized protein n=1 Tax=Laetiporus sulphureus 93-53 TaxID=1314785 RepID=A0A165F4M9_9APHY|nr:uncharacterized protein LAESUDRAFT_676421 [Laetiporus sulphureus 93-53]KZT08377.1 hypothetical protein LAESUDRAFT_676421 [Laetiporus sulphureus 93-53]
MNPSFATNETTADLWFEQSINAGTYVGAIAYGVHVLVFFSTLCWVIRQRANPWTCVLFVSASFILGSLTIIFNIRFNELAWIDYRNYPGGPLAFLQQEEYIPEDRVATVAPFLAAALSDGLLIYRCYVIWDHRWSIIMAPLAIYLSSIVMAVFFAIQFSKPDGSLWNNATVDFSLPYFALSMSLNVIVTTMLVVRLLYMRRRVASALGPEHGKMYTSIAAIVVESALPYGVVSFIFLVSYGLQSNVSNLFLNLLVQVECMASEVITLRVARGRAWTRSTLTDVLSNAEFAMPGVNANSDGSVGCGSTLEIQAVDREKSSQDDSRDEPSNEPQTRVSSSTFLSAQV